MYESKSIVIIGDIRMSYIVCRNCTSRAIVPTAQGVRPWIAHRSMCSRKEWSVQDAVNIPLGPLPQKDLYWWITEDGCRRVDVRVKYKPMGITLSLRGTSTTAVKNELRSKLESIVDITRNAQGRQERHPYGG